MALAPKAKIRAHVRRLSDSKLRALHKTVNDLVELAAITKVEGKTARDAADVREIVNAEYTRRFPTPAPEMYDPTPTAPGHVLGFPIVKKPAPTADADAVPAMTRRAALDMLEELGGHSFMTSRAAIAIGASFGLTVKPYSQRANTGEYKGLTTASGKPETISGYAGVDLAEWIAESFADDDRLPRAYRMQMGRGSRHRSACETIAAALELNLDPEAAKATRSR